MTNPDNELLHQRYNWKKCLVTVDGVQQSVTLPYLWSEQAATIVAKQYLLPGEGVHDMVHRVVNVICQEGLKNEYFDLTGSRNFYTTLSRIVLDQKASFNSPVWYNVGRHDNPQCSACFINSVQDNMSSIMDLVALEAKLFKQGSGSGVNFSQLRGKGEPLSNGGTASGPVSFMRGFDAFAGVIRSGGRMRRAAKMVILDADHPDIEEFIWCKALEERKAKALARAGFAEEVGNPSVFFQNANHSVRVTDAFMNAALNDRPWSLISRVGQQRHDVSASDLLRAIAEAAWECGDPAIQFADTINSWHTCTASGTIIASNPCSEFMFLGNTACNLASINLVSFVYNGAFDVDGFVDVVYKMVAAQDILVDLAGYPSEEIRERTVAFRPLGLGYTNLGAAIMRMGYPYDSEEARSFAAAVTALMTGAAYEKSSFLGSTLGAFPKWEENKARMTAVIDCHKHYLERASWNARGSATKRIWIEARSHWAMVSYPLRNAQVTLLAPTGTISFMMDCDTTGIEPAISLVHNKKLADGTVMRMVNRSVEPALHALGYGHKSIEQIMSQLEGSMVATDLQTEDLEVFDCAIPDSSGRHISVDGHLSMMASVQPFLSGAISKTVNLPSAATVEDVEQVFIKAWNLRLKSVAVYRDMSKTVQPIVVERKEESVTTSSRAARRRLPETRKSMTHKFVLGESSGYLTVGLYEDGSPGEVFVRMSKTGSVVNGLVDAWAVALSFGLQYGVPLEDFVHKFSHMRFEPSGYTKDEDIPVASSVVDYVIRWLDTHFGSHKTPDAGTTSDEPRWCIECGSRMVRSGACFTCSDCGSTTGCG